MSRNARAKPIDSAIAKIEETEDIPRDRGAAAFASVRPQGYRDRHRDQAGEDIADTRRQRENARCDFLLALAREGTSELMRERK
jgi:hypothetical protein